MSYTSFNQEALDSEKALQMIKKLEKEKDRHERNKEKEKERHKQKKDDFRKEAGITELVVLYNQISELGDKLGEQKSDIQNLFYTGVWGSMSRKKTYVNEKVTIREKTVYRYGKSLEAKLSRVIENKWAIIKEADDNRKDNLREGFKLVEDIRYFKKNGNFLTTIKTDAKYDGCDIVKYTPAYTSKVVFANSSDQEYRSDSRSYQTKVAIDNLYSHRGRVSKEDVALTVAYQDEIIDAFEQTIEKLEEEIERREEIKDELTEVFKKQLMMVGMQ